VLAGSASMKEMERTNAVVVRNSLQGQESGEGRIRRDSYTINIEREKNCYNCGGFGYITRHCRSWEIVGQKGRIEYGDNCNHRDNLKEE